MDLIVTPRVCYLLDDRSKAVNVIMKSILVAAMTATFATGAMAQGPAPTTGAPPSRTTMDPSMIPLSERCASQDARLYADCAASATGSVRGSGSTSTGVGGGGGSGGGAAGGGPGGAGSGGTGGE
jgi:uncharacterized membrane protein YgcG